MVEPAIVSDATVLLTAALWDTLAVVTRFGQEVRLSDNFLAKAVASAGLAKVNTTSSTP